MAVYSNIQIKAAIEDGRIVCHPYNPRHVNHASLDLTLGHHYYRVERANERTIYNPFDAEEVERYFDGPYKAMPHGAWCKLNGITPVNNIPFDHPIIVLKPGERILAHTHEFVGIKPPGGFELKTRSTWTRNGIVMSYGSGWIDPGYTNRVTLVIQNLNERETVLLPIGEHVAQAVFMETGEVEGSYGEESSKYQLGTDMDTIIRVWAPDMMLPKAYKDERSKPPKIDGASYE